MLFFGKWKYSELSKVCHVAHVAKKLPGRSPGSAEERSSMASMGFKF
jgi:hypothetical protein